MKQQLEEVRATINFEEDPSTLCGSIRRTLKTYDDIEREGQRGSK